LKAARRFIVDAPCTVVVVIRIKNPRVQLVLGEPEPEVIAMARQYKGEALCTAMEIIVAPRTTSGAAR